MFGWNGISFFSSSLFCTCGMENLVQNTLDYVYLRLLNITGVSYTNSTEYTLYKYVCMCGCDQAASVCKKFNEIKCVQSERWRTHIYFQRKISAHVESNLAYVSQ